MANTNKNNNKKTNNNNSFYNKYILPNLYAVVTVIDGNLTHIYNTLPQDIQDIIDGIVDPTPGRWDEPHIDAVASLINKHPNGEFSYWGKNDRYHGGGAHGETHWELAQQRAKELL